MQGLCVSMAGRRRMGAGKRTCVRRSDGLATTCGSFGYRLASYNPGFSLVAIDPGARHGVVMVEFHGFHNQVTNTRMHIELTRAISDQWYSYWLGQFERIWQAAKVPAASQPGNT
jgi:hypothetical protein